MYNYNTRAAYTLYACYAPRVCTSVPFIIIYALFFAGDGMDACYTRVNTIGNMYGHCGVTETSYLPCSDE